jgi:hypothetical protein
VTMSTSGESYQGIFKRIGRSLVAGVVATGVLWVLKLTSGRGRLETTFRSLPATIFAEHFSS